MRGVITIAIDEEFGDYAKLLAKTLDFNNDTSPRAVITNLKPAFFEELYDIIIQVSNDEKFIKDPFFLKLHLLKYTPFEKTLYLDADCVTFGNLDMIWQHFELSRQDFFTYGYVCADGIEYEANVTFIKLIFGTSYVNVHNGGLYAFKRTEKAYRIFQIAEDNIDYFDNTFPRTNPRTNHVSDEILFSYAMCRHNLFPFSPYLQKRKRLNGAEPSTFTPLLPSTQAVRFDILEKSCFVKFSYKASEDAPIVLHYAINPSITKFKVYSDISHSLNQFKLQS